MSLKTPTKITALLGATALAVTLAACAPADEQPTPATDITIIWSIAGGNLANGHMDPHSSQLNVSNQVNRAIFDSLVFLDVEGNFSPWLAKEWSVSEDGLEYTFMLRDDVTFHDGEPFNAAAAVANFEHVVADETSSAKSLEYIGGDFFKEAVAVSDYELKLVLHQPFGPLLTNLSTTFLGFYSPKVFETYSQDEIRAGGPAIQVGTGPFILTEYSPNQEMVFERNEDYNWAPESSAHQGPAVAKELVIRIVPEESSRIGALSSGEVQISTELSSNALGQLGSEISVERFAIPGMPYSVYLNLEWGVFNDKLVRQAFMYGIDIDTDVNAAFGGAYDRAWSILSPTVPNAYDASLENSWPVDQDKAAALLDQAGWTEFGADGIRIKEGQRLSVEWLSWTPFSDEAYALVNFMVDDLKQIGFELTHSAIEGPAYQARYYTEEEGLILDFDLTDWSYTSIDADALRNHLHTNGYQNASRLSDPELDQLLETAATATDPAERERIYQQIQQWNFENVAILPLYYPEVAVATVPGVTGLTLDVFGSPIVYGVGLSE